MWYFSWILGVLLAASFGIVNVMWLELVADDVFGEGDESKQPEQDQIRRN